jgi:hypothetical protein
MKIRPDRDVLAPNLIQNYFLGEKDPVLNYEETKEQIENTSVKLVTFPDMSMKTKTSY